VSLDVRFSVGFGLHDTDARPELERRF